MRTARLVLTLVGVLLTVQGCAAIALPAVGTAAVSAGAGEIVKVGTAYTAGGAAYRTFSVSVTALYEAVRQTLDRLGVAVFEEDFSGGTVTLRARAIDRAMTLELEPITPVLTRLRVAVREDVLRRDRATAAEIVAQIGRAIEEAASALPREP